MSNNRLLRSSWLFLTVGAILSLFSGGRWMIPLAVWLAPVFLIRFERMRRPGNGYLLISLVRAVAACITLQGVIPAPAYVFYPVIVVLSFVNTLPYLADRLLAPRLRGFAGTFVFPLAVTALEYLSALSPFGTFHSTANSQFGNLPLMQLASVTGIWGITFLITWLAPVVNWAFERGFAWSQVRAGVLAYVTLLAAVLLGGAARLALLPPQAGTVRIVGLSAPPAASAAMDRQLSMDEAMALTSSAATSAQRAKARAAYATVTDPLFALSQQEAQTGAKIVVWPEAGASVLQEDEQALIQRAGALAGQHGIYIDLGLAVILANVPTGAPTVKNETVLLGPDGKVLWTYEKAHPVPFTEAGVIVPGSGKVPSVPTPYGLLANVICFDLDFPGSIRQAGLAGVDVMLAPSNDWREVEAIHAEGAIPRAIENGFTLVRQSSHGLSSAVDYEGRVLAASDYFTSDPQVLVANVPVHGVRTIYAEIGDVFAWLCVLALVALTGLVILQSRRAVPAAPTTVPQPEGTTI